MGIAFGNVALSLDEQQCLKEMNRAIWRLPALLPSPLQTEATLYMQRHFVRFDLKKSIHFCGMFYPPVWSGLYWINREYGVWNREELVQALQAQAVVMFLHMIDDHLVDSQVPLNNLSLQLRTEAYNFAYQTLESLARGVSGGEEILRGEFDSYFSGIHSPPSLNNYSDYCDLFRNQMATGMIALLLAARKAGIEKQILHASQSFGLAWRLIDDYQDYMVDRQSGSKSAFYYSLAPGVRTNWKRSMDPTDGLDQVDRELLHHNVPLNILGDIRNLLDIAAEESINAGLWGLSDQYYQLNAPIRMALFE